MSEKDKQLLQERAMNHLESWKKSFATRYNLTQREVEILALITRQGLSNKEIAEQCSISEKTVKNHLTNIMSKIGTRSMRKLLSLFINHAARYISIFKV
ncbi:response regulator transcription factor [Paenibacillus pini]|uniref:response regulator transcription factor n=1 Tax=Paenibacillus pini TaxID=669461 RepID=UPI0006920651|nr:LuxR C-terminal-related transcriptional regulator [Paenibacillus pini]